MDVSAAARVGDSESAVRNLDIFVKAFLLRNGFHANGDQSGRGFSGFTYRPFTLEGNFLAAAAVHEMLLQSWSPTPGERDTEVLRIFPATPWRWHEARFDDLRAEGGHRVSARRENNATTWLRVIAGRDGLVQIRDNFGGRTPHWNRDGVTQVGNRFEVPLRKDEVLEAYAGEARNHSSSPGQRGSAHDSCGPEAFLADSMTSPDGTIREQAETMKTLLSMLGILLIAVATAAADDTLDLSGDWRVRLDPEDQGLRSGWPATALVGTESIRLPNTTDRAGLGFPLDPQTMTYPCSYPVTTLFPGVKEPTRADQRGFLVRRRLFVGPAWYERTIRIPDNWTDRIISLRIERTIWKTEAWIDGRAAGSCDSLVADHIHELGPLSSGEHRLTVRVDNRMIHNLSTITHSYGPETQSRWNGMIGKLELISRPPVSLGSVRVFPATDRCSARVQVEVLNKTGGSAPAKLEVHLVPAQGTEALAANPRRGDRCPGVECSRAAAPLAERPPCPGTNSHPVRYRAAVGLQARHGPSDQEEIRFGFRQIERVGQGDPDQRASCLPPRHARLLRVSHDRPSADDASTNGNACWA